MEHVGLRQDLGPLQAHSYLLILCLENQRKRNFCQFMNIYTIVQPPQKRLESSLGPVLDSSREKLLSNNGLLPPRNKEGWCAVERFTPRGALQLISLHWQSRNTPFSPTTGPHLEEYCLQTACALLFQEDSRGSMQVLTDLSRSVMANFLELSIRINRPLRQARCRFATADVGAHDHVPQRLVHRALLSLRSLKTRPLALPSALRQQNTQLLFIARRISSGGESGRSW